MAPIVGGSLYGAQLRYQATRHILCLMSHEQNRPNNASPPNTQRLQTFLAHSGVASRRHAAMIIASGRVQVNGQIVREAGARIDPQRDTILLDGHPLHPAQHRYVLLHKPAGYVSTTSDPQGRPTVLSLLPKAWHSERLYPVGRLDYATEGLLLLTNDGGWALRLTHPRYHIEKEYHALVSGHPRPETLARLTQGIHDPTGTRPLVATSAHLLAIAGPNAWIAIVLHEGRKREVRRMLAAIGHPVRRLMRVRIGALRLQGLAPGAWRELTAAEVAALGRPTGAQRSPAATRRDSG